MKWYTLVLGFVLGAAAAFFYTAHVDQAGYDMQATMNARNLAALDSCTANLAAANRQLAGWQSWYNNVRLAAARQQDQGAQALLEIAKALLR